MRFKVLDGLVKKKTGTRTFQCYNPLTDSPFGIIIVVYTYYLISQTLSISCCEDVSNSKRPRNPRYAPRIPIN